MTFLAILAIFITLLIWRKWYETIRFNADGFKNALIWGVLLLISAFSLTALIEKGKSSIQAAFSRVDIVNSISVDDLVPQSGTMLK